MGPTGRPETSVRNYHSSLRNDLEERSSHLLRGGGLKSYKVLSTDRSHFFFFLRFEGRQTKIQTNHIRLAGRQFDIHDSKNRKVPLQYRDAAGPSGRAA